MLFPNLLGALGVRRGKAFLQDAEVSVMSIMSNKERICIKKSQTFLPAAEQEILSKTIIKSDEPFTAEAVKCCVEASLAVFYSNGLEQSPCTLGTK